MPRYTLFLILYPAGYVGEFLNLYNALPYFAEGHWDVNNIPFYPIAIFLLVALTIGTFYVCFFSPIYLPLSQDFWYCSRIWSLSARNTLADKQENQNQLENVIDRLCQRHYWTQTLKSNTNILLYCRQRCFLVVSVSWWIVWQNMNVTTLEASNSIIECSISHYWKSLFSMTCPSLYWLLTFCRIFMLSSVGRLFGTCETILARVQQIPWRNWRDSLLWGGASLPQDALLLHL